MLYTCPPIFSWVSVYFFNLIYIILKINSNKIYIFLKGQSKLFLDHFPDRPLYPWGFLICSPILDFPRLHVCPVDDNSKVPLHPYRQLFLLVPHKVFLAELHILNHLGFPLYLKPLDIKDSFSKEIVQPFFVLEGFGDF